MPSSISSSDASVPAFGLTRDVPKRFARALIAGGALFLLFALGTEIAWRSLGHTPSADAEDLDLWAYEKARALSASKPALFVLGNSRAQLGVDIDVLRRAFPHYHVTQLALRGRSAVPVLLDLARDPQFNGAVLLGAVAGDFTAQNRSGQKDAVDHAKRATWENRVNAHLRAEVAQYVTSRSSSLPLSRVIKNVWHSQWPRPDFVTTRADRASWADFSRVDTNAIVAQNRAVIQRAVRGMRGQSMPQELFLREVKTLKPALDALQARGGKVVLLHLPQSGNSRAFEDAFWPKSKYWDPLGALLSLRTVHYLDHATLRDFTCPDGSHLDSGDSARFTENLVPLLSPWLANGR